MIIFLKQNGIQANLGAQAVHMMTFFKQKYKYQSQDFRNSSIAYKHGLALPMGDQLSQGDVEEIGRIINLFS